MFTTPATSVCVLVRLCFGDQTGVSVLRSATGSFRLQIAVCVCHDSSPVMSPLPNNRVPWVGVERSPRQCHAQYHPTVPARGDPQRTLHVPSGPLC